MDAKVRIPRKNHITIASAKHLWEQVIYMTQLCQGLEISFDILIATSILRGEIVIAGWLADLLINK